MASTYVYMASAVPCYNPVSDTVVSTVRIWCQEKVSEANDKLWSKSLPVSYSQGSGIQVCVRVRLCEYANETACAKKKKPFHKYDSEDNEAKSIVASRFISRHSKMKRCRLNLCVKIKTKPLRRARKESRHISRLSRMHVCV